MPVWVPQRKEGFRNKGSAKDVSGHRAPAALAARAARYGYL